MKVQILPLIGWSFSFVGFLLRLISLCIDLPFWLICINLLVFLISAAFLLADLIVKLTRWVKEKRKEKDGSRDSH